MDRGRVAFLLGLLLTLSACQAATPSGAATPAATASPAGEATAASGDAPATSVGPEDSSAPDIPPGVIVGEGEFFLPDPLAGLAELGSHRATLTVSFEGTVAGAARAWSRTTELVASGTPSAGELTVSQTGDLEAPATSWAAERDGVAYSLDPDGACAAGPIDPEAQTLAEPAAVLSALIGGQPAGHESVNGVETDVFTFDEGALGLPGDAPSTGKAWIATTGGYLVRLDLATQGGETYFGENTSGTVTTHYELTDVNGPVSVTLPKDCPPGLVDAPLMADATDVESGAGALRFTTQSSVADVAAFYKGKASSLKWKAKEPPAITKDAAFLLYTAGDLRLEIIATKRGTGTRVEIVTRRE